MSLSFLFCKPWHPATTWNQKKIWEAEQKHAKQKDDEERANKELTRERDRRHFERMAGGRAEPDATSGSLEFMYAPPPGFQQSENKDSTEDDEEVKKFKALAKMKSDPNFSAAAKCSELEKLVGRKVNPGVSLAEQQERFSFLKNAPVEHEYTAGVKVNFKPFNKVVRHVKCMRCGEWGHRSGDRECSLANENPNDAERRLREDPLSYMAATGGSSGAGASGGGSAAGAPGDAAEEDPDHAFLKTLSTREKKRLLRRLKEMEELEETEGVEAGGSGDGDRDGDRGEDRRNSKSRKRKREHKSRHKHKHKHKHKKDVEDAKERKSHRKSLREKDAKHPRESPVPRVPPSPSSSSDESRIGRDRAGKEEDKRMAGRHEGTKKRRRSNRGGDGVRGGGGVDEVEESDRRDADSRKHRGRNRSRDVEASRERRREDSR